MSGMMVSIFVLGVLSGWLVEWIFVKIIMDKKPAKTSNEVDDSSDSKEEVKDPAVKESSNGTVNDAAKEVAADSSDKAEESISKDTVSSEDKESTESADNGSGEKETNEDEAASEDKESTESADNGSGEKEANEDEAASEDKKSTESADNGSGEKKANEDEVASEDKKSTESADDESDKNAPTDEDFTILKGIGPKLSESIKSSGINSFAELAKLSGDELLAKLEEAGAKVVNKTAFVHIPKQAKLAAKGDWAGLDTFKKSI